ncbi:MAG: glycosyltransferase [Bryobacterales bacterium]|nr:glycosyltransferase [Bryobacterales bacterium]
MKTLHITNAWHERSGGIATFYKALFTSAERRGQSIRLVAPGEESRVEDWNAFVRVYYVRSPRAPFDGNYRLLLPQRYLWRGGELARILQAERPDLVEICDKWSVSYLAGLLRRGWAPSVSFRPTVVGISHERMDVNWRTYFGSSASGDWFCGWYMKWLYFPMFDHHIANSEHTAEELRMASRGHDVARGVWIRPMGVESSLFHPGRRNRVDPAPLLLYVGRLAPEKNLHLLWDAVERLHRAGPKFRFQVAGDGPLRGELQAAAEQRMPGRVEFLGHLAGREQLADLMANADVFLHANPAEPFGIAPLEAMASGVPLVCPRTGGVRSYANEENAWLTETTPEAYASSIGDVLEGGPRRDARVAAARATAEAFDWSQVADAYLDLYAEMHAHRSGAKGEFAMAPDFMSTAAGGW